MATPEGTVKGKVKKYLKGLGAFYFMPVSNGMGVSGIPDFIVCLGGRFIGIETKAPGRLGNTTQNQRDRMDEIDAAGGITIVTDNVDHLHTTIQLLTSIKMSRPLSPAERGR